MGIHSELFIDQKIAPEFICTICHDVLDDPVVLKPCEHAFCQSCAAQWRQRATTCPVDRQPVTGMDKPQRLFSNLLNALQIRCPHSTRGCTVTMALGDLQTHEEQCGSNPGNHEPCAGGCGAVLNQAQIKNGTHNCVIHLKEQLQGRDSLEVQTRKARDQLRLKEATLQVLRARIKGRRLCNQRMLAHIVNTCKRKNLELGRRLRRIRQLESALHGILPRGTPGRKALPCLLSYPYIPSDPSPSGSAGSGLQLPMGFVCTERVNMDDNALCQAMIGVVMTFLETNPCKTPRSRMLAGEKLETMLNTLFPCKGWESGGAERGWEWCAAVGVKNDTYVREWQTTRLDLQVGPIKILISAFNYGELRASAADS